MTPVTLPPSLRPSDVDYRLERYGVAQAAVYLNVSTDVVYREAAEGRLSHRRDQAKRTRLRTRKPIGRLHFSQADLDQWRQARRHETSTSTLRVVVSGERREPLELSGPRRFA